MPIDALTNRILVSPVSRWLPLFLGRPPLPETLPSLRPLSRRHMQWHFRDNSENRAALSRVSQVVLSCPFAALLAKSQFAVPYS
jgi:hypothetical protein